MSSADAEAEMFTHLDKYCSTLRADSALPELINYTLTGAICIAPHVITTELFRCRLAAARLGRQWQKRSGML